MKDMCISCGNRPVEVKKWRRCKRCYQQYRRGKGFENNTAPSRYCSEMDFIKNFFEHKNWIYQPGTFRLGNEKYSPDFYDGERNIFIEVSGSQQAFSNNRHKYQKFIELYPKINFEIRYTSGDLLNDMFYHIPKKR